MSSSFDERRRGFESKWAQDVALRFQVEARRNRLLGEWAAAEKGLSGQAVEDFIHSVLAADLVEHGDEDVFRHLRAELDRAKYPDAVIRTKMAEYLDQAADAVMKG